MKKIFVIEIWGSKL